MERCIALLGAPVDCGSRRPGCRMGPDALRIAGLSQALSILGHKVEDKGNVTPVKTADPQHPNTALHQLGACAAWVEALAASAAEAVETGNIPIFMGGDHLMSAGTVAGAARGAGEARQFVLWLDAHSDFHSLETTQSGNLHGTPVAYFTGQSGFDGYFPPLVRTVDPADVLMLGTRSVDVMERDLLAHAGVQVVDMRAIDEQGIAGHLRAFLQRVQAANGRLHVSIDVDFLDPAIAPAVGTTVPGGATFREAHLAMEMLCDSGLVSSVDIAELNPFLDDRGQTARLLIDLISSLFGKRIMDRPTRSF